MRAINFSAGPCTLPLNVLEEAQNELVDYQGRGMSLLEMSHRSPEYEAVHNEALALSRAVFGAPDDFAVLFLQGGATVGPLTLPRFYALHSVVLPLATILLLVVHLLLIRRHGITPPWQRVGLASGRADRGPTYYPDHVAKELAAGLVLVLVLGCLAIWIGAPQNDIEQAPEHVNLLVDLFPQHRTV